MKPEAATRLTETSPSIRSYWLTGWNWSGETEATSLPSQTPVAIIGAGISGISTAYWLGQLGIPATVIEQRQLSGGATGRNGGHITPGTTERFSEAVRRYGAATAVEIWQYSLKCTDALRQFVLDHHVACDLNFNGSVTLALHPDERRQLEETAELLAHHGLPGQLWDRATCAEQVGSSNFLCGLFNPTSGQLWPARLVAALATQAARHGAQIHTGTGVDQIERTCRGVRIKTDRGTLLADHVVYATNAWTGRLLPALAETIVPVRGQVLLTAPVARHWSFNLSTNWGYEYWLQRPDGRIVLGGMRHQAAGQEVGVDDDSVLRPEISAGLRGFLPRHFADLADIVVEQEWTGIMGYTTDKIPLVGPLPGRPGEFIVAGFSGHGMPLAFSAGRNVAELIAGQTPDQFVDAFLPSRLLNSMG